MSSNAKEIKKLSEQIEKLVNECNQILDDISSKLDQRVREKIRKRYRR